MAGMAGLAVMAGMARMAGMSVMCLAAGGSLQAAARTGDYL